MAVDNSSGKQARLFPCLAILRYTVATVVTVLAVVVIVVVTVVGVRPDDVIVSVVQGHVGTMDLWKETPTSATGKTILARRGRRGSWAGGAAGEPYSVFDSCFGPGSVDESSINTGPPAYTAVESVWLDIILSVDNPSGRGSIYCESINVTFRAGTAPGMEIGVLPLPSSTVKPQTSHKISSSLRNPIVLGNIATRYGGESRFTGMVEVTMNTSSVVTLVGVILKPQKQEPS